MKKREKALNKFKCEFLAKSVNEGFSRMIVASFAGQLDPKVNEIADMKTIVSEAVTNCIVHGYKDSELPPEQRKILISGEYYSDGRVVITIKDRGIGIDDVKKAMEPLYTTDAENERSGMGFTIMESFSDGMTVRSRKGKGTSVRLVKKISIT